MAAGREDSKTVALGGLIARFTADRDAMLAQIHACQERVQDLVGRLGEQGVSLGGPSPASSPERLDELETAVALLREEVTSVTADGERGAQDMRSLVEAARTTALQAMERAERASADVDAVLERLGVEIARLETEGGAGELGRLARVVEQLGGAQAQWEATFADDAARRESLADAVARLETVQAETERTLARLEAEQTETAVKVGGFAPGAGDEALAALRRDLEAALAAVVAGQRPLADGLDELQQAQQAARSQVDRLREVVEGLTGWAGSAVPREALEVLEAGVGTLATRLEAADGDRRALRDELRTLAEAVAALRTEAGAMGDEIAHAAGAAVSAQQAVTGVADGVAELRGEVASVRQAADAAMRAAAEVREASDADRRRMDDLVRREVAALRAAFEGGLAGLCSRIDGATRGLDALAEARDRLRQELAGLAEAAAATDRRATADDARRAAVDGELQRIARACALLDERLRMVEEEKVRVVATRDPEEKVAWWGAAEALWVQVSAFVATPIIDFREALWQLARAASSAAKFW